MDYNQFTHKTQKAISNAQNLALTQGHQMIENGHLLKAIFEVDKDFIPNLIKKFGNPQYIKIDVEGYELNVIKGLTKKSGIISFEITSEFFDEAIKCLKHLKKLSYNNFTFSIGERKKFF